MRFALRSYTAALSAAALSTASNVYALRDKSESSTRLVSVCVQRVWYSSAFCSIASRAVSGRRRTDTEMAMASAAEAAVAATPAAAAAEASAACGSVDAGIA